ncbi:hypothetical protein GQR58_006894 [Nymphon striatum]|nr:hypothetical protein GQR58_006894 [Nymphon striatum]
MSKNETTDALVSKFTEEFTKTASEKKSSDDSNSQKDAFNSADINSFWKLPLENWQQHANFYSTQQQTLGSLSKLFEDAMNNPEFFAAVQSYLLALQKYQWVFFNLFTTAAKQTVEILKLMSESSDNNNASDDRANKESTDKESTNKVNFDDLKAYGEKFSHLVQGLKQQDGIPSEAYSEREIVYEKDKLKLYHYASNDSPKKSKPIPDKNTGANRVCAG